MKILAGGFLALLLTLAPLRAAEEQASEKPEKEMIGWKWANFAILAGALGYLAVKKGGPYFEARSQEIRAGIAEAEKSRAAADARAAEVNAKLVNLDTEILNIRKTLRAEQQHEADRLQRETAAELARVQAHALQEIEASGKAARMELRRYSAHLALELAEGKIRERITPQTQEELTRAFARELHS